MEAWSLLISKRIRPKRLSFNKLIMVGAEGFELSRSCHAGPYRSLLLGQPLSELRKPTREYSS